MNDLISRQAALDALADYIKNVDKVFSTGKMSADDCKDAAHSVLDDLPSEQPPLEEFEWCTSCKEYDQKNHCCHRFTKVILQTVEELKAQPQRMRGKWIKDSLCTTSGGTYAVRRCSLCDSYYHDVVFAWNYCPHCGADMREGSE